MVAEGRRLTPAQLADVAAAGGFRGDARRVAVAVALAESGGRVDAVSPTGCCAGLWQIHRVHGYDRDRLLSDPAYNARAAFSISKGGSDWRPWEAYTNGSYRQFLEVAATTSAAAGIQGAAGFPGPPVLGPGAEPVFNTIGSILGIDEIGERLVVGGLTLVFTAVGLGLVVLGLAQLTKKPAKAAFEAASTVTGGLGAAAALAT